MNRKETELRLKRLQVEIASLKKEIPRMQKELSAFESEQTRLVLSLMTPSDTIGVSDHAILRYLERKFNIDIDSIRDEILTPDRKSAIRAGATKIKTEYVDFIVKNNTIVTSV